MTGGDAKNGFKWEPGKKILSVKEGGERVTKRILSSFAVTASVIIGTLRSEDGDGRENVAEKVNSRSFNLHRDYTKSLTLSNVGELS